MLLKKTLLGGLLGGIVMFMWLGLAWSTWHMTQFHNIPRDKALAAELVARDMASGLYYYPGMPPKDGGEAAMETFKGQAQAGPTISFMSYRAKGYNPDDFTIYLRGMAYCLLSAGLLAWLLASSAGSFPGYLQRLGVCTAVGAIVAFAGPALVGNFFMFPPAHVLMEMLDQVIGWSIAGLVIAAVTGPSKSTPASAA